MRWLLIALLWSLVSPMKGQQDTVRPPDGTVVLRAFNSERIDAWRADPSLDYDRDLRRVPSPWERFKEWLGEMLDRMLGSRFGGFITENLLYLIVTVILIFALITLGRGGLRRVFHGAPRSLAEVNTVTEDIRQLDLGLLISEAERSGDLRRAIRLHYLLVLRKLVDQGVLHWSTDLTDRDYMAQIANAELRARFARIVLVFQWVWYGHAEVHPARYDDLRRPFVEFETTLVA